MTIDRWFFVLFYIVFSPFANEKRTVNGFG